MTVIFMFFNYIDVLDTKNKTLKIIKKVPLKKLHNYINIIYKNTLKIKYKTLITFVYIINIIKVVKTNVKRISNHCLLIK